MLAFYSGDLATAQAEFEAALAVYERAGFSDPTALATYSRLASVCLLTFELDRAVRLCEECMRRCDELGEQWARGTALWVARRGPLAVRRHRRRDRGRARLPADQGGRSATCTRSRCPSTCCRSAWWRTGDFERTAVLHGAERALWTLLNAPVLMGPAYAEIRKSAADTARAATRRRAVRRASRARLRPVAAPPRWPWRGARRRPRPRHRRRRAAWRSQLTRREREIAGLVADGLGNREIAEQLYLSKRTVDSHMEHIFAKLGFTSRTQLAAWVLERGERP